VAGSHRSGGGGAQEPKRGNEWRRSVRDGGGRKGRESSRHVEEGVEVHAAVAVLAERPLLRLPRGRHLRIHLHIRLPHAHHGKEDEDGLGRRISEEILLTMVEGGSGSSRRGAGDGER
jgi:hypothetical protein